MIPVYQTRGGRQGNCWPACLASLLELPLEDVDHCCAQHDDFHERSQRFLADRGLFYLECEIRGGVDPQHYPFSQVPHGALVIGCDMAAGDRHLDHVVVLRAEHQPEPNNLSFMVIHDPARSDGSLRESYNIQRVILLCRLFI